MTELVSIGVLPETICWNAVGMKWDVLVEEDPACRRHRVVSSYPALRFVVPPGRKDGSYLLYKRWFIAQADVLITPLLQQVSEDCKLPYVAVSYGHQKTLWGSCSSDKCLRFNAKLLYLSPRMLRYVMIHELCHTKQMNHQPAFWALVQRFEPDYREIKRQMRHADRYIPAVLNG